MPELILMFKGTINTKYSILVILSVIILALNWAALHDIIKGNEPDLTAEYFTVILSSSLIFVGAIILIIRKQSKRKII